MANSLEFSVESYFIALFAADSRSAGKKLSHFDEEDTAGTNAIVFQAKEGAQHLAADAGCSELEVLIEYRSPIGTSRSEGDQGAALIHQVVYASTLSGATRAAMATTAGLGKLLIKDEATGDRSNSSDLRKRTVTLPIVAKLA